MYAASPADGPLRQGEIISDLAQSVLTLESVGTSQPLVDPRRHPYAIIASQDCDLEQDFKLRQAGNPDPKKQANLPAILFYEVVPFLTLARSLDGDIRRRVMVNKDERYQVLQRVPKESDALGLGIDDLGIDFKRYFTISTAEVYKLLSTAKRRCFMASPYMEHFANRAAAFQCRVALPEDHQITLSPKT